MALKDRFLLAAEAGVPDTGGGGGSGFVLGDGGYLTEEARATSQRRLGPCQQTLPFPTEFRTGEKQTRMKVGTVRPSEGPWLLTLIKFFGGI